VGIPARCTTDAAAQQACALRNLDDDLTSYRELEGRLGQALIPPAADASADEWSAFYGRIGRPEKPEGYAFNLPDGLPEQLPYDDAFAMRFKTWAHEAGLSARQAQALHDQYLRDFAGQHAAAAEAEVQAVGDAHDAIVKAWGDPASEAYKRKVRSPAVAFAFAKVGEALYAEDALHGGPGSLRNPFSGGQENLTEQGRLIRSDPETARALIRAAGKNPRLYGLG
jgi:hypothetical protein